MWLVIENAELGNRAICDTEQLPTWTSRGWEVIGESSEQYRTPVETDEEVAARDTAAADVTGFPPPTADQPASTDTTTSEHPLEDATDAAPQP